MPIRKDDLTKIVCTIGPASEKRTTLEAMIKAGMDIARLNFSHGSHDWHLTTLVNLRHAAWRTKKSIAIMADIQGPRIRISELETNKIKQTEIELKKGERIILKDEKGPSRLPGYIEKQIRVDSQIPLIGKLKEGDRVYLDNGMVELVAKHRRFSSGFEMEVKNNGTIKTRKGINFPTLAKFIPSFTSKDKRDLTFALKQGVDLVALSFVKNAKDILNLRIKIQNILGKKTGLPLIIAKIETVTALENLKEILEVADAIMVARGDMGVETLPEKVPVYQKLIIRHSIRAGVPVIVATNMLESMTDFPRPTRAELTDVANAVIDRSDAVMLSGETASGKYPIRSVQMMSKIIRITEKSPYDDLNRIPELDKKRSRTPDNFLEMVTQTIYNLSIEARPEAIVMKNTPVSLVGAVSNLRPNVPICCYVGNHNPWTRKLVLFRGIIPYVSERKFKLRTNKLNNYLLVSGTEENGKWRFSIKLKYRIKDEREKESNLSVEMER